MASPVWRARKIATRTKIRMFDLNVKAVLFYGCELGIILNYHTQTPSICKPVL